MSKTSALANSKQVKKDEFYTQLSDIEKEMKYYKEYFKDKVIFCNCDDPTDSNFWKYFELNFTKLGLKRLISTHYETDKPSYMLEINRDENGDGLITSKDIIKTTLKQNGDFRSSECIELLKQADIVITNPPFSLFREYVAQLIEYDKKFIIIGNVNAITYKEFFPLIKENKVWLGASIHSGDREFKVPNDYPMNASGYRIDELGNKYIRVKGVRWWSNIDYPQRHEDIILYKTYNPEEYPKYDNYNAINVDKTSDIPSDYYGIIGVPITFLDRYNPSQFKILGCSSAIELFGIESYTFSEKFMSIYKAGKVRTKGNLQKSKPCYIDNEGFVNVGYHRIFIQRINQEGQENGD